MWYLARCGEDAITSVVSIIFPIYKNARHDEVATLQLKEFPPTAVAAARLRHIAYANRGTMRYLNAELLRESEVELA